MLCQTSKYKCKRAWKYWWPVDRWLTSSTHGPFPVSEVSVSIIYIPVNSFQLMEGQFTHKESLMETSADLSLKDYTFLKVLDMSVSGCALVSY